MEKRYTLEEYYQEGKHTNKIYIAGPISMFSYLRAVERFDKAEKELHDYGYYITLNPIKLCAKHWEREKCMSRCLDVLLGCDAIYMQRLWWLSKGARLERKVAIECGIDIIYQ